MKSKCANRPRWREESCGQNEQRRQRRPFEQRKRFPQNVGARQASAEAVLQRVERRGHNRGATPQQHEVVLVPDRRGFHRWPVLYAHRPPSHSLRTPSQRVRKPVTKKVIDQPRRWTLPRMRRTALLLVLCAVRPMTARQRAVRSQLPQMVFHYRGDAGRSGSYAAPGTRTLHGKKWQAVISSAGFSAPVYANGVLYVPDGGGHIIAYDANTGAVRWTSAHLGDVVSAPTITADLVYAGVDGNGVVALSVSNGAQVTKFVTDSEVFASPVIDAGVLYAGCESGGLYAFDLTTQHQLWRFNAGVPLHGHPAVANRTVIVGAGNSLIGIDSTGRETWRLAATHGGWSPSLAVAGGMV